jgi:hypothetical protein
LCPGRQGKGAADRPEAHRPLLTCLKRVPSPHEQVNAEIDHGNEQDRTDHEHD